MKNETGKSLIGKTVKPAADPSHNVWGERYGPLEAVFHPRSVAIIGATEKEGSVGRTLLVNLTQPSFKGKAFPVNPKHPSLLGHQAFPNVASLPERPDLAVIATPAETVPGVVEECVRAGVKAAIIISAGFKETGPEGARLEKQILEKARGGGLRIVGPNCLGVMNPLTGLNATFAGRAALPGHVGFISQSGALCTAVLDWSLREHVGFSAFVSIGSMLDVGWGDLIDYLGNDPETNSILIYMETIGDARSFLSAARETALRKPIIVLKAGRTDAAAKAAVSHTGSIAGSDDVLDAAFRRCGALRVNEISELFDMAEILAKQPRPKGPRLTVLTNAGGPGVLAADELISKGGELAKLSEKTIEELNRFLPQHWSHGNPVDILGDAGPARYAKALGILSKDPENDGLLVILTPQAMTDPLGTAEALTVYAKAGDKPVLASWMGGSEVGKARDVLNRAGLPVFAYPDEAARLFCWMWQYARDLKSLYETPLLPATCAVPFMKGNESRTDVRRIAGEAAEKGRVLLTEFESKRLLHAYGIPVVPTETAGTEEEAVKLADRMGYPVVLKLHSETVTHKTDVGGVRLGLERSSAVGAAYRDIERSVTEKKGRAAFLGVTVQPMVRREGYELILGSSIDAQFGPVILFGAGGQLVEVFRDHALGLPPLNTTLARRMLERTRIFQALKGVRGRKAVDLGLLEDVLVRFSQLVVEERRVREIDVNPLLASGSGILALDARVVLQDPALSDDELPKLAIRPYPSEYAGFWKTKDGEDLTIRPIRPEDEPLMVRFHAALSERSVRLRYLRAIGLNERIAHERLARVCFNDYDRDVALVAERTEAESEERKIAAVARLSRIRGTDDAEFAIVVSDAFQRRGLGAELVRLLLEVGRKEGIHRILAHILPENAAMRRICEKAGFSLHEEPENGWVRVEVELR